MSFVLTELNNNQARSVATVPSKCWPRGSKSQKLPARLCRIRRRGERPRLWQASLRRHRSSLLRDGRCLGRTAEHRQPISVQNGRKRLVSRRASRLVALRQQRKDCSDLHGLITNAWTCDVRLVTLERGSSFELCWLGFYVECVPWTTFLIRKSM